MINYHQQQRQAAFDNHIQFTLKFIIQAVQWLYVLVWIHSGE